MLRLGARNMRGAPPKKHCTRASQIKIETAAVDSFFQEIQGPCTINQAKELRQRFLANADFVSSTCVSSCFAVGQT